MIGYEMGFFHQPRFTLWPRLFRWRDSSVDEEMTRSSTWQHFLGRGVLWRSSFWGNLKTSDKKLGLWRLQLEAFVRIKNIYPFCLPYQPLSQIALSRVDIFDRLVDFFTVV